MSKRYSIIYLLIGIVIVLSSCSTTKFVPQGEYLLNSVKIKIPKKEVPESDLRSSIKQNPNYKTLGMFPVSLYMYDLSGKDSTKWLNRVFRKAGNAPVIYDSTLVDRSERDMMRKLENIGYLYPRIDVQVKKRKKKANVTYVVYPSKLYEINDVKYNIPNQKIRELVLSDTLKSSLHRGAAFDRSMLEQERDRLATLLINHGYYGFNREYINYTADTVSNPGKVNLQLNLMPIPQRNNDGGITYRPHRTYQIRNIYFQTDYDPMRADIDAIKEKQDTIFYQGYNIIYGKDRYLTPETLISSCYIQPNTLFNMKAVENTYSALGRLRILKFFKIDFVQVQSDTTLLDCKILLTKGKSQTMSVDLEGTNSAGDLGFAVGLTYQNRNLFNHSETFTTKVRVAYESLSGDLGGLINNNYSEYGIEANLSYPRFLFPFLSRDFRKRLRANTEFNVNFNYQMRPEYTRVIAGATWRYRWFNSNNQNRHLLDLLDISYIYLPQSTQDFLDKIDPDNKNPLLRYSYENHFIMRSGYMFYRSNVRPGEIVGDIYTFRTAGEIAGNLLNAISNLTNQPKGENGEYRFLGIRYAQYAKLDVDYAYTFLLNTKNSIALHAGAGIGLPYGNSEILPFEKRYFSGGANSVRGWSVRGLGPGTYRGKNEGTDFFNQCGDIRLDLNAEYRAKLIWVLELALFVDAGNIWTIKNYKGQEGGVFKFNKFYEQIALSYGLGLRFDFNFFVLRLDWGIQLYDPSLEKGNRWVFGKKNIFDTSTLHFAVGYPF